MRLLAGSRGDNVLVGGVEIKLNPGWKTYWRTPGDSGVPPRFDFSKSDNVGTVTVLWPAPKKFDDGAGGTSIGYTDKVVLPLRIVPKDAAKPVTLRATVDYAICEKLCVPVQAESEVAFTANPSIQTALLANALQSVPRPAKIGDGDFAIRSVRRDGDRRVVIEVSVAQSNHADIFVEGPNPHWALPVPRLEDSPASGPWRFAFDLDGIPPGETATGAPLKMTLVGSDRSFEYTVTLN
jgi:DsbC/DsbD-like thiol-disulfide interchange protein